MYIILYEHKIEGCENVKNSSGVLNSTEDLNENIKSTYIDNIVWNTGVCTIENLKIYSLTELSLNIDDIKNEASQIALKQCKEELLESISNSEKELKSALDRVEKIKESIEEQKVILSEISVNSN